MNARPGATLGRFDRAVVRDGNAVLEDGSPGLLYGTLVGPPAWEAEMQDGDEVLAAVPAYGVRGVLVVDGKNGEVVTIQQNGRHPCRVSAAVNVGDRLSLDPATPGHLVHDTTGNAVVVATALEAAVLPGQLPLCRLENLPLIPPDASGA